MHTTGQAPPLPPSNRVLAPTAYDALGAGFLGVFLGDLALVESALLPVWYGPLRVMLTTGVLSALLVARLRREHSERGLALGGAAAASSTASASGGAPRDDGSASGKKSTAGPDGSQPGERV